MNNILKLIDVFDICVKYDNHYKRYLQMYQLIKKYFDGILVYDNYADIYPTTLNFNIEEYFQEIQKFNLNECLKCKSYICLCECDINIFSNQINNYVLNLLQYMIRLTASYCYVELNIDKYNKVKLHGKVCNCLFNNLEIKFKKISIHVDKLLGYAEYNYGVNNKLDWKKILQVAIENINQIFKMKNKIQSNKLMQLHLYVIEVTLYCINEIINIDPSVIKSPGSNAIFSEIRKFYISHSDESICIIPNYEKFNNKIMLSNSEISFAISYVDKQIIDMIQLQKNLGFYKNYWGDKIKNKITYNDFCKGYQGIVMAIIPEINNFSCPLTYIEIILSEWFNRGWTWKEAILAEKLYYMDKNGNIVKLSPPWSKEIMYGNVKNNIEIWKKLMERKWTIKLDAFFVAGIIKSHVPTWLEGPKSNVIEAIIPDYVLTMPFSKIEKSLYWLGNDIFDINGLTNFKNDRTLSWSDEGINIKIKINVHKGNLLIKCAEVNKNNIIAIYPPLGKKIDNNYIIIDFEINLNDLIKELIITEKNFGYFSERDKEYKLFKEILKNINTKQAHIGCLANVNYKENIVQRKGPWSLILVSTINSNMKLMSLL